MTSISAAYSNTLTPLQQLQDQLQADVNSGAISSSDQGALSSALNDINSSLQSNPPAAPASGTSSSPADLKSKIDSLIANEVSSGKFGVYTIGADATGTNFAIRRHDLTTFRKKP